MNNYVPVWGLVNEIDDTIRAKCIVEGTSFFIFDFMVRYYDWALAVNSTLDIMKAKESCIKAAESQGISPPHLLSSNEHLLNLFAKWDPLFYKEDIMKELISNNPPLVIAASGELSEPLDIDVYLDIYSKGSNIEIVISVIMALVKMRNPIAIKMFSEQFAKVDVKRQDAIFDSLSDDIFIPELTNWLAACSDRKNKINIIAALGNCGCDISEYLAQAIQNYEELETIRPTLMRTIRCYGSVSNVDFLISSFNPRNPILCETIIYALGHILREKSSIYLEKWFHEETADIIRAASLETIARYNSYFVEWVIDRSSEFADNPYMMSALIRSIEISRYRKWVDFLPQLLQHPYLLLRLCAARALAFLADAPYLLSLLNSSDTDDVVKSVIDEKLYCRRPFLPDWLNTPYNFDLELVRLPIRLTWADQPKVCFQSIWDINLLLSFYEQN